MNSTKVRRSSQAEGAEAFGSGPPRTKRSERRRTQLFSSALELFVRQGYEATTMEDIAVAAGVARATVFNHFPRKAAFLEEWMWRRRERAREAVRLVDLDGSSAVASLRDFTITLAQVAIDTRDETTALMEIAVQETGFFHGSALANDIARYVRSGQRSGEIRPDLDAHHVGLLVSTGFIVTLSQWIREPGAFDLQERVRVGLDMMLYGMAHMSGGVDQRDVETCGPQFPGEALINGPVRA